MICSAPGRTTSVELSCAVSEVELMNVANRFAPFTKTSDRETKFLPVICKVRPFAVPTRTFAGLIELTCGTPLVTGEIVNIVKGGGG